MPQPSKQSAGVKKPAPEERFKYSQSQLDEIIQQTAQAYDPSFNVDILHAIQRVERPVDAVRKVSRSGAEGPVQIMPHMKASLIKQGRLPDDADMNNPEDATVAAIELLKDSFRLTGNKSVEQGLAAYNNGYKSGRKYGTDSHGELPLETRLYPKKVVGELAKIQEERAAKEQSASASAKPVQADSSIKGDEPSVLGFIKELFSSIISSGSPAAQGDTRGR